MKSIFTFSTSLLHRWRAQIRLAIEETIDSYILEELKFFYKSIFIPSADYDFFWVDQLIDIGLIHVVVLSGFHIGVMTKLCGVVFGLLPRSLYSVGVIKFQSYENAECYITLVKFIFIFLYCYISGFPIPCQRAFCCFCVSNLSFLTGVSCSQAQRILKSVMLHIILFPWNAWTDSFFLCWLIYISLFVPWTKRRHLIDKLKFVFINQMFIAIILLIFFSKVSILDFF